MPSYIYMNCTGGKEPGEQHYIEKETVEQHYIAKQIDAFIKQKSEEKQEVPEPKKNGEVFDFFGAPIPKGGFIRKTIETKVGDANDSGQRVYKVPKGSFNEPINRLPKVFRDRNGLMSEGPCKIDPFPEETYNEKVNRWNAQHEPYFQNETETNDPASESRGFIEGKPSRLDNEWRGPKENSTINNSKDKTTAKGNTGVERSMTPGPWSNLTPFSNIQKVHEHLSYLIPVASSKNYDDSVPEEDKNPAPKELNLSFNRDLRKKETLPKETSQKLKTIEEENKGQDKESFGCLESDKDRQKKKRTSQKRDQGKPNEEEDQGRSNEEDRVTVQVNADFLKEPKAERPSFVRKFPKKEQKQEEILSREETEELLSREETERIMRDAMDELDNSLKNNKALENDNALENNKALENENSLENNNSSKPSLLGEGTVPVDPSVLAKLVERFNFSGFCPTLEEKEISYFSPKENEGTLVPSSEGKAEEPFGIKMCIRYTETTELDKKEQVKEKYIEGKPSQLREEGSTENPLVPRFSSSKECSLAMKQAEKKDHA